MSASDAPQGTPILALAGVDTYYGDSHILQGVTLSVEPATITCLLGRNGAGKTTTVRTVMGFTPPRAGRIAFRGRDITGAPPHRVAQAGIALVPQGRGIFPDLTVRQQLTLAPRPGGWPLGRVYERFPVLGERAGQPGELLSGGEQQMLSIGRALMTHPELIFLDEATEGLAPLIVMEIWRVIGEICASGIAALIVDHDYRKVLARCDRTVVLQKGQVVLQGSSEEVTGSESLAAYLGV
jgi:branched-chain amino acid transport system ATP-binding protein